MSDDRIPPTPSACWDEVPHDWHLVTAGGAKKVVVSRKCRKCCFTSLETIDLEHDNEG